MLMLSQVSGVDKNIIDVNCDKTLEHIHTPSQPMLHNPVFILARWCDEDGFTLVTLPNSDQIVCAAQVQLEEDAGASQLIQDCWNQGKRIIMMLDRLVIQRSVVDTRPQAYVLFCHEEEA